MDWEEYLANLESADEQNYKRLFGEEYIKKSDVEKLIIAYKSHEINHINILQRAISALPTINLSVIDEMIEELTYTWAWLLEINARNTLRELKQRLSITK